MTSRSQADRERISPLSFAEAVKTCLRKYGILSGRARPSEFWWWSLFAFGVWLIAALIHESVGDIVLVGLILPTFAAEVRRLHDTGRSGYYILLYFIPLVGAIILIVFLVQAGDPESNQYGDPVAVRAPA